MDIKTQQIEYHSNPTQLREFEQGSVWHDFKEYIKESIAFLQLQLEGAINMEDIRKIQGRLEELRIFGEIPSTMIEDMEYQATLKENKDGGN